MSSALTRGHPKIKFEGEGGKPVVDFDGKSQMITDYNFRGLDLIQWRNEGFSAFGVSRYTGGDRERVISSAEQIWLFGHNSNQIGRYYFNGWVDQGFQSDTNFHIFETLHQGRSDNTDPSCTVWTDGIEGSYRRGGKKRSNNWNFIPGRLSFGAWSSLSETSKCQVAEFLIFEGLIDEGDRLEIEGYLAHKWGIPLPSSHPWSDDPPAFGQEIISGNTPVIDTNRTFAPSVVNRTAANLKNTSASLTGRIVNTGMGVLPFNPVGEITTTFSQTPGLSPPVLGEINASNISHSSANLNGNLISTGGEKPEISIVWGDEDHGSDYANLSSWDNYVSLGYSLPGPFSLSNSDLDERNVYFFRVAVSNSLISFVSKNVGVFVTNSASSTIPEPILWLDATDSSANSGTWLDKSSQGNNAVKHGSPSANGNKWNNLPVMEYSGSNGNYHEFSEITDARTILWVVKPEKSNWVWLLGDNNRYPFHPRGTSVFANYANPNGARNGIFWKNGVSIHGSSAKLPPTHSWNVLASRAVSNIEVRNFSNDRNINGRCFRGDLAELIIYNKPLSDTEIQFQEGYLAHKWGLQDMLPESHPFKTIFMNSDPVVGPNTASIAIGDSLDLSLSSNIQDANITVYNLPSDLSLSTTTSLRIPVLDITDLDPSLVSSLELWLDANHSLQHPVLEDRSAKDNDAVRTGSPSASISIIMDFRNELYR